MRDIGRYCLIIVLHLAFPHLLHSQEPVQNVKLDSVTVLGHRTRSIADVNAQGLTLWNMSNLSELPQILSNADPIHYTQMLPGIQTQNEYRSGINIEGCDSQHNLVSIEGVPIYNVNHLLGFFSTFNSSHFSAFSIGKEWVSPNTSNRIGGQLNMLLPLDIPEKTTGIISVGLLSSQGTIRIPTSKNTSLTLSARGSYMNLLYSRWLREGDQQIRYSFYDINATLVHKLNQQNLLIFDLYNGNDRVSFNEENYLADMKARWGNSTVSIHWHYLSKKDLNLKNTFYITSFRNKFDLSFADYTFRLPSSIRDFGLKSHLQLGTWFAGFEVQWHNIQPQTLQNTGYLQMPNNELYKRNSIELTTDVHHTKHLSDRWSVRSGIQLSLFTSSKATYGAVDPSFVITYNHPIWEMAFSYTLRHQYLFQIGFSDFGLPTEYWMTANENYHPQYAHSVSLGGSSYLFNRKYKMSARLFYRKLYRQLEYKGSVLDYVNSTYNPEVSLINGKGTNYGFSITLNKRKGNLIGWISYTYTHAARRFDELDTSRDFPSIHERPHEVNMVATYSINKHWNLGSTFVFASGTPYTTIRSAYVLNNNIVASYGKHNDSRLAPYIRWDISVNYKWHTNKKHEQGMNFSLYNVSCRKNELFYYVKTRKDGSFSYQPVSFVLDILPSISYYCKF